MEGGGERGDDVRQGEGTDLIVSLVAHTVKKRSAMYIGSLTFDPGSGTSLGGGHGNPLHYSCLENSMDRGAWQAAVLGVAKSGTQLNN